ncbi:MAG TPA: hypothetical protein VGQ65_02130 [Thermoanaerobaculia bacterium]|nr:hypothetical protein [Thermoanaerobaculia bacterium]
MELKWPTESRSITERDLNHRELEQDVAAGRLDHLTDEALAEYERGETTEL